MGMGIVNQHGSLVAQRCTDQTVEEEICLQEEGLGMTGSLKKSFPPSISSIFTFFSQAELTSLIAPKTLWKINSAVFEILERLGPSAELEPVFICFPAAEGRGGC